MISDTSHHPKGGPPSKGPHPAVYYRDGFNAPMEAANPYPETRWLPFKYWAMGNQARKELLPFEEHINQDNQP